MSLTLNDQVIGEFSVQSATAAMYEFPAATVQTEGPQKISITFRQPAACTQPGQDVNLYIQGAFLKRTGDAPVQPLPTPAPTPTPDLGRSLDLAALAAGYRSGVPLGEDGTLAMYWIGAASAPYEIPAGTFQLRVEARGEPGCDMWPQLEVDIDGKSIGAVTVDSTEFRTLELPTFTINTAGTHTATLRFRQAGECTQPGQDVNLYIQGAFLKRTGDALAQTLPTPAPTLTPNPGLPLDLAPLAAGYRNGVSLNDDATLAMYWIGAASAPYDIPAGTFQLQVEARGEPGCDMWPQLEVDIDGKSIGAVTVDSSEFRTLEFPSFTINAAGTHTATLRFRQPGECTQPGQDVNLFVRGVTLR
jgi:hypothetical protein